MKEKEIVQLLKKIGAYKQGHFILRSGDHSDVLIEKDLIETCSEIGGRLASSLNEMAWNKLSEAPDLVVGITGPSSLATEISSVMDVPALFLGKGDDPSIAFMKNVVLFESVIKDKKSIKRAIDFLSSNGVFVIAIACVINIEGYIPPSGIELLSLMDMKNSYWPEEECLLCRSEIPIDENLKI